MLANTSMMCKEDWLLLRKNGIGGSDASAILGLNPYKSILEVYMDKITPVITKEDLRQTESQYWGTILEDVVANEFSNRTGLEVVRCNYMLQHPRYPFMIADLDRIVTDENVGLECKTASEYKAGDWEDGVPDYYFAQVQHYMAVTGFDGFYVAVLIGGNKFRYFYVERDEEYIEHLIKKEKEFWHHVQTKTAPEPDGSKATQEYIDNLFPVPVNETVNLSNDIDILLFERDELQKKMKKLEKDLRKIENTVKQKMGEAEKAYTDNWRISWVTVNSTRLNTKKLQAEHPEIYEKYVTTSSYRRFHVSTRKGNN